MTCKRCGGNLTSEAARMIRVCIGCIQASHAPQSWPSPPGYGWNPMTPTRGQTEPEIE